jgi:peptidoglycan/LPS O-acetylase OafA/YrhL
MPATSAAPAPTTPYYPALTGLRAVAAYLVFLAHFRSITAPDWYARLAERGGLGVGMFFVLSGFVIAARYQSRVQFSGRWWRTYCWRRFARIYPVFFLLNSWVLWQAYWPVPREKLANTLLLVGLSQSLLKGFSNTLMFVGLPQSWSLTVEECFYFTAPLVLVWQLRWRWAPLAFAALMVLLGLALTALCIGRPQLHGLFGSYRALFNYMYFGRVCEFMAGLLLARWWGNRPAASAQGGAPWRTASGLLLMALAAGWLTATNAHFEWYQGYSSGATAISIGLFPLGVVVLLAGLLAERSWLRALLATPLLQALGRSSYFFYLFHVGVFSQWWQHQFGWGRYVGWQFVATLLISELGYRLLEEPARRWILARTLPRGERS